MKTSEKSSVVWAGTGYYLSAVATTGLYIWSSHPDKIALLFAATMFMVNGAAARVIAHVKESE